jgi:hypothetical protein
MSGECRLTIDLLVGCPVASRGWILPAWFEHVRKACAQAGVQPSFLFVASREDAETVAVIEEQTALGGEHCLILDSAEAPRSDVRVWGQERYAHMVRLRNQLLEGVRIVAPRMFLSVDSDILLHPDVIANMIQTAGRFDAVGGRLYMTPTGVQIPSYGMWKRDGAIRRADAEGVFKVDVIMALKLMTPRAYHVDYRDHRHGEDIGWSRACQEAGVKLGWDGRVISKHVLSPQMHGVVDRRVGW